MSETHKFIKKKTTIKQELQIRVISLEHPNDLICKLKTIFPGTDIAIQQGVDLRSISIENIYRSGIITHGALKTLTLGRKWHHELPSKGAVGLSQTVKIAISDKSQLPPKSLLIFEDDCVIKNETKITKNVDQLLKNHDQFDIAVFGALLLVKNNNPPCPFMDNGWYFLQEGDFFRTQSVLYTPNARLRLKKYFYHNPIEMQIDGLYSSMAHLGMLRILVQLENVDTIQSTHISNVQEFGGCKLCFLFSFMEDDNYYIQFFTFIMIVTVVFLVTFLFCINNNKKWKVLQTVETNCKSVHLYSQVNIRN